MRDYKLSNNQEKTTSMQNRINMGEVGAQTEDTHAGKAQECVLGLCLQPSTPQPPAPIWPEQGQSTKPAQHKYINCAPLQSLYSSKLQTVQ